MRDGIELKAIKTSTILSEILFNKKSYQRFFN